MAKKATRKKAPRRPAGAPGATGGAALTAWFCYALTTVVLFTGYTKKYLERRGHVGMLSAHCDVVIAGPYIPKYNEFTEPRALRGSINQEVLILKGGISMCELTPLPDVEMVIQDDGSSVIRGFPDLRETLKDVVR